MRKAVLLSLAIACAVLVSSACECVASAGNEPIRLMRRPDINNGRIVFTWAGDLWMVSEEGGIARRITVHEGNENNAKFSPDGKWIAFSGDINSRPSSVCVIPAEGTAEPMQLTFQSAGGGPVCWTRDGRASFTPPRRNRSFAFSRSSSACPRRADSPSSSR